MMTDTIVLIVLGIIIGVVLVRYGISVGYKLAMRAANGMPLDKQPPAEIQAYTGEE